MLGTRGQAFKDVMKVLDGGRIGIGAMGLGLGRAAFEFATKYGMEREQFGKPVAMNQALSFRLADIDTELEAARLLIRKAADLKDAGRDFTVAAARAKLFATEKGAGRLRQRHSDARRLRLYQGIPGRAFLARQPPDHHR